MSFGSAKYYEEYKQNEVSTSNQGKLILMMYEGAIRNVTQALACLEKKNVAGKSVHISKTVSIINELSMALNMKKGGEVAEKLERLYQHLMRQLTLANIKAEPKILLSTLKVLTTLQSGWEEIVRKTPAPTQNPSQAQTISTPPLALSQPVTPPPAHKRITARC